MTPVEVADVGARLDVWLVRAHPELSRARVQKLIERGDVTVNDRAARASLRLRMGDRVALRLPPPVVPEEGPKPERIPVSVLYEDADIVVVNKPAGMVVHPAAGARTGTLVNALLAQITDLAGIGGELRPGLVHRLDRFTSGAMVVAKSDAAMAALQSAFRARTVEKTYLAMVHGAPAEKGVLDTAYGRHPRDRKRFTSKAGARRAVTRWVVRERFAGAALVEVSLETGRTHQIRVHFSEAGHPLLADVAYGGTKREAKLAAQSVVARAATVIGRQALHAWMLTFCHPRTGARIVFEAPIPADFAAALRVLRDDVSPPPFAGEG